MGESRRATTARQYEFLQTGKVLIPGLNLCVEGFDPGHREQGIARYREFSADIK
jgi:hypothetical protein